MKSVGYAVYLGLDGRKYIASREILHDSSEPTDHHELLVKPTYDEARHLWNDMLRMDHIKPEWLNITRVLCQDETIMELEVLNYSERK